MIFHSEDYVEYCRETATHLKTLHDLALRGAGKEGITAAVHERIVKEVGLQPDDFVVDIGCGDGTLLRRAQRMGVRSAVGLLATQEEVAVVRRTGLNVKQGLADKLPLEDKSASVIVCNNVLLIVPQEKIPASLREIRRIAKPEARVFIGEIPFVPGPEPEPHFETARETLSYIYRKHGVRAWLGMLRRMGECKLARKPIVVHHGTQIFFYATPNEFIGMAREAGLRLVRHWQHEDPKTRNDYLFTPL